MVKVERGLLALLAAFAVLVEGSSVICAEPPCHWMDISHILGSPPVDALAVQGESVAFVSGAGVLSSDDSGRHWRHFTSQDLSAPPLWGRRFAPSLLQEPTVGRRDDGARGSVADASGGWPLETPSSQETSGPVASGASASELASVGPGERAEGWTALVADGLGGWEALDSRRLVRFASQGWQRQIPLPSVVKSLTSLAHSQGVSLMGSRQGVWRRRGRGAWRLPVGGPLEVERVVMRGVHAVALSSRGAFESFDAGVTWRRLPTLPVPVGSLRAVALGAPEDGASPEATWSIWAGAGESVWRLDESGRWRRVGGGRRLGVIQDLEVLSGVGVVAATSRGVWRWSPGARWVPWGVGMKGRSVRHVSHAPTRLGWLVGTSRGLWACAPAKAFRGRSDALERLTRRWSEEPTQDELLRMARRAHPVGLEGEGFEEGLARRKWWPQVSLVGMVATAHASARRVGPPGDAWRQVSANLISDASVQCVLTWDLTAGGDAGLRVKGARARRDWMSSREALERRVVWLSAARRHVEWERAAWGPWESSQERLGRCVALSSLRAELLALVTRGGQEAHKLKATWVVDGCGDGAEVGASPRVDADEERARGGGVGEVEQADPNGAGSAGEARSDSRWQAVMSHFEHEPDVRSTQAVVLAYAQLEPWRVEDWGARARWSHLAPVALEGRAQTTRGRDDRFSTREELDGGFRVVDTQTSTVGADEGQERLSLGVRWDLSRLVFNPEELDVAVQSGRHARLRQELLGEVTRIYYERRHLQVEQLLTPPSRSVERVRLQLRIDGLTAELDAMTGGWFSAHIRPRGEPVGEASSPR